MYYLGNTTLRTSPRNIPLILSLYIYIYTVRLKVCKFKWANVSAYIYIYIYIHLSMTCSGFTRFQIRIDYGKSSTWTTLVVNNWGFPEGMYYLGNTALRTSPPNSTQIFSLYIFMTTSKITLLHYYIYIYIYICIRSQFPHKNDPGL